jgi:hypothetical protein
LVPVDQLINILLQNTYLRHVLMLDPVYAFKLILRGSNYIYKEESIYLWLG